MITLRYIFFCCVPLLWASTAIADNEDPERIRQIVQEHVILGGEPEDISVSTPALDRPLNLPRCESSPEAFDPPGSDINKARRTIGIRCAGSWTFYVPTVVTRFVAMVAIAKPVGPGHTLTSADLTTIKKPISSMPLGYIGSLSQALGQKTRQSLAPGVLLRPSHLRAGHAVKRGQSVRLVLRRGGLEVESSGESLTDGAIGAWVKVKNAFSGRIVEGRVESAGLVRIP